jgi:hypothetical protein
MMSKLKKTRRINLSKIGYSLKGIFLFVLAFSVISACRQNPGADPGAVKEELREREIVHLTEGQIAGRAAEMGDSLLLRAQIEFLAELGKSKDSTCLPAWNRTAALMKNKFSTSIQRLPFSVETRKRLKNEKEIQVMDAYLYNYNNSLPVEPNLQKDGGKEFLFSRALLLSDNACQKCHGSISNSPVKGLKGDTVALWMLRYSRKQVVMSFVE